MATPLDPDVRKILDNLDAWGRHATTLTGYIERDLQVPFARLLKWRAIVARRTFTIELKVDLGDEGERFEPMKDIVLQFAQDLLATSALLASDVKPPKVSVFTEDMFMTTEEIEVRLPQDGAEELVTSGSDQSINEAIDAKINDQLESEGFSFNIFGKDEDDAA